MLDVDSSSDREPMERLAEEFAARHRRGERPSIDDYAGRYPQWADQIRDLFPALLLMERLKPESDQQTGSYPGLDTDHPPLKQLGDYRILREVGRGGMGIVYEAEQVSLGRHVAVKVLPAQTLAEPQRLQRFQREARAAARLHHTNIVPVFGVGEYQGCYYYVMQLIQGQGLHQVLHELAELRRSPGRRPVPAGAAVGRASSCVSACAIAEALATGSFAGQAEPPADFPAAPPTEDSGTPSESAAISHTRAEQSTLVDTGRRYWLSVARIGLQVADALAHAHAQNVLHRDIKPSNLLLDLAGVVWVTDFGLAKALGEDDGLTRSGDIVGTLRYLAPERLHGRGDARSDVYSLGLTLYEFLTLRPAFDARDRTELLHQVLHAEPTRPRKIDADVPRDLETIVLKAIDREPARRYASAAALADDLHCFLEDRPIRARRVGRREQVYRWCRRNPLPTFALALAATAVLAVALLSVLVAYTRGRARDALAAVNQDLLAEQDNLKLEQQNTEEALSKFRRMSVLLAVERAGALAERHEPNRALLWLTHALADTPAHEEDLQLLLRTNLASLRPRPPAPPPPPPLPIGVSTRASSPDGRVVLRSDWSNPPQLIDSITGKSLGQLRPFQGYLAHACFSPDGKRLATAATVSEGNTSKTELRLWDAKTAQPLRTLAARTAFVSALIYSPDGQSLLTGHSDGVARLWDPLTGAAKGPPLKHLASSPPNQGHLQLAFSPDGKTVVTVGGNTARLWDAATGRPRGEPLQHQGPVFRAVFSPGGRFLGTVSQDKTARLWDPADGKPLGTLEHHYPVKLIAFSPDEHTVATEAGLGSYERGGPHSEVRLWTIPGQSLVQTIQPTEDVNFLLFSPDGRALLVATQRMTLLFAARTGEALLGPIIQSRESGTPASRFSADGLGVEMESGTWDLQDPLFLPRILAHRDVVGTLAFSPDGSRLVTGTQSAGAEGGPRHAYVWDLADSQPLGKPMQQADRVTVVAFSPDGKLILTAGGAWDGTARLWHADTGQPHGQPLEYGFGSQVQVGAFSTDGRTVLLGGYAKEHQQTARLWDVATCKPVGAALVHKEAVATLAYSPDGKTIVTGSADHTAQLWDAATGKPLGPPLRHEDRVESVAFSPDGRRVLTASMDRTARVWDAASGELALTLRHDDGVLRASFSPSGKTILTASQDRTARLWDAAGGKPIGLPWQHDDRVLCAAFSPDGRIVATGCADGKARFWAAETGMRIGPPLPHPRPVKAIAFSPTGGCIATTCEDQAARLWDAPTPVTGNAERLALWVEVETGLELDAAGAVHVLSPASRAERRRRLTALGGPPPQLAVQPEQAAARHLRVALDCADKGEWFAAAWHLDRVLTLHPSDWTALLLRGRANLKLGRLDRAAADYEHAFRIGPPERVLAACNLHMEEFETGNAFLTDAAEKQRSWQKVVWYLDRMIAVWPGDWRLYDRRGQAHLELNQLAQADADYERALALGPDLSFFYRSLGPANGETGWAIQHAQRRQWDRAARDFARAVELGCEAMNVWSYHALLRLHVGDQDGYRRACADFLSHHKDGWYSGATSILAGICALGPDGVEDLDRLVRLAETAAQDTTNGRHTLLSLGAVLGRAGRFEDAIHCLQEGLLSPNGTPDDWLMLALAHARLGHRAEAKKWRDKAADWLQQHTGPAPAQAGQSPWAHPQAILATTVLLDEFDNLDKRDAKRLAALTKLVEARPDDPRARVERGWFHANRGQWEAALKDFDGAIQIRPKDARLWLQRACYSARRGLTELADADFTRATQLRPEDVELRLECARARAGLHDWRRAALDFVQAVKLRPADLDLRLECGQAFASAGLWEQAIADFSHVTHERPEDAWGWYLLALAHLGAGDRPAYQRTCVQMKERFGSSPRPRDLQRLLYACVVRPDGLPGLADFTEVARRFGMLHRPWGRQIGGAFLCRTGQYDAAIKRLDSFLMDRPPRYGPYDYLFLALAHHQQKDAARAKDHLRKAVEWMDAAGARQGGSFGLTRPGWDSWRDRLIAQTLRREVEALLGGDRSAAPR